MRPMKLRAKLTHAGQTTKGKVYDAKPCTVPGMQGWWKLPGDDGKDVYITHDWAFFFDEVHEAPPVNIPVRMNFYPAINGVAEPEWKVLRNALTAPGNCACGCPRQQCDYHKDVTA